MTTQLFSDGPRPLTAAQPAPVLVALLLLVLVLVLAAATGCTWQSNQPTRLLEVAGGGQPVFTAAEMAQRDLTVQRSSGVAPAAFVAADEPRPLKVFDQWTEQEAAALALGRIGDAAIPDLVQALSSAEPAVRRKAVEVLGRMGSDAAPAVPELVKLLDDPSPPVRKASIRTLGQIGPAAKDAVPALVQTLLEPAPRTPQ